MTTIDAAATLGLEQDDITPEAVERNYREKVKHCHPDKADYPGAAAEFKRATEAYDELKKHANEDSRGATQDELSRAAEDFSFGTFFTHDDIWGSMRWWEKARSAFGLTFGPAGGPIVPAGAPLVVRTFGKQLRGASTPVLIAPIPLEIVDLDQQGDKYLMGLRPVDTEPIRAELARSVSKGKSIEEACHDLAMVLIYGTRMLIHGPAERLKGAA